MPKTHVLFAFLSSAKKDKKDQGTKTRTSKSLINIDFFIAAEKLVIIRSNISRALRLEPQIAV